MATRTLKTDLPRVAIVRQTLPRYTCDWYYWGADNCQHMSSRTISVNALEEDIAGAVLDYALCWNLHDAEVVWRDAQMFCAALDFKRLPYIFV